MTEITRRCTHTRTYLMCPPEYFAVQYKINPWMNRAQGSDADESRRQWRALHDTLVDLGATIELLEPVPGLPDLVFTANAGLVYGELFLSARTVQYHLGKVFAKLQISSRLQLQRALPDGASAARLA